MLNDRGVPYRYRDYRQKPLSEAELRRIFNLLGVGPRELLRRRDRAFRELGLEGDEPDAKLIQSMAANPTLLQRPIAVLGERAVIGRPPENILALVE